MRIRAIILYFAPYQRMIRIATKYKATTQFSGHDMSEINSPDMRMSTNWKATVQSSLGANQPMISCRFEIIRVANEILSLYAERYWIWNSHILLPLSFVELWTDNSKVLFAFCVVGFAIPRVILFFHVIVLAIKY